MIIGKYTISDNWAYHTKFVLYDNTTHSTIYVFPYENRDSYIIYGINMSEDFWELYYLIYGTENHAWYPTKEQAKDRIDEFLNKLYKLKVFL